MREVTTLTSGIKIREGGNRNLNAALRKVSRLTFWALIYGLAILYFFEAPLKYFVFNQMSYGVFWQSRYGLFLHIIGGSIALLSGPIQFLPIIRKKYLNFHRWMGRLYLAGILLGSSAAFYLAINSVVGWMFGIILFALAIYWLTSTAMAFVCIRCKQIEAHKVWMTRSYIVTFSFLIFRLAISSPLLAGVELHQRFTMMLWFSWMVPLFGYEIGRQIKSLAEAKASHSIYRSL